MGNKQGSSLFYTTDLPPQFDKAVPVCLPVRTRFVRCGGKKNVASTLFKTLFYVFE